MYCINVKEQFDVRFIIKALIFSRQSLGIQYVPSTQCSGATYYLLRVLAMLSFSVIMFYPEIEIGPYSLYRKKVISAFKLNNKIVRSRY